MTTKQGKSTVQDYMHIYIHTLEDNLQLFGKLLAGLKYVFQQNNASNHVFHKAKTCFNCQNITILVLPTYSPYLKPIKNVCNIISRKVYTNFELQAMQYLASSMGSQNFCTNISKCG